jgi:hypothetical protein
MTDGDPVKPVEDVSPYLQQPLRTLEQAQQDRQRRLTQTADAEAKWAQRPASLAPVLAAVDAVSGRGQSIGPEHTDEKVEVAGCAESLSQRVLLCELV